MGVVFYVDGFNTSPDGTPLADHIANTGEGYVYRLGDDIAFIKYTLCCPGTNTDGTWYSQEVTPPSADYYCKFYIQRLDLAASQTVGCAIRWTPGVSIVDAYIFTVALDASLAQLNWFLYGANLTVLASGTIEDIPNNWNTGTSFKLSAQGTTIKCFIDDTELASIEDAEIVGPGKIGIGWFNPTNFAGDIPNIAIADTLGETFEDPPPPVEPVMRDTITLGTVTELIEDDIYPLPSNPISITVITGDVIEISLDGENWTAMTLDDNKNFVTSAIYIRSHGGNSTVIAKAL